MPTPALTTPAAITEGVRAFSANLTDDDAPPFFVAVNPLPSSQRAQCFANAARAVGEHGGQVLHGWQIFEWPDVLREAHFHAIWVRPDGDRVDVTPAPDGEPRMLFQRDVKRTYTGNLVPSAREALWDDPSVHEYIQACQAHEAFRAKHWVDLGGDECGLDVDEREELEHERLEMQVALARRKLEEQVAARLRVTVNPLP